MKKVLIIVIFLGIGSLYTSYKIKMHVSREILNVFGFQNEDFILNNILCSNNPNCNIGVTPPMANRSVLKALATGDKVNLAKELFDYIKVYCNSREFKDLYEQKRQEVKPFVPEVSPEERDMALAMVKEYEEMYTPELLAMLPPEAKAGALQSLEDMKAQAYGEMTETQKKEWEALIPENPNKAISKMLKDFLDVTRDVDFNATTKLNPENKHLVFTNPVYEKKDRQWKACYRAGKELTEEARRLAQQWYSELN